LRNGDADGVSDELPAMSSAHAWHTYCRLGPALDETLQAFRVSDMWRGEGAVFWIPDSRRRGNPQRRAAFQRRDCIDCPSQPAETLGPVKPTRDLLRVGRLGLSGVSVKENLSRVFRARREEQNPMSPLRESEGSSIDYPVGPGESQILKTIHQEAHRPAPL